MKRIVLLTVLVLSLCVQTVFAKNVEELKDLTGNEYYYEYVKEMVEKGVINGYPNSTFGGSNNITWAEALTMVLRSANIQVEQIAGQPWYEGTRQWYLQNGIISESQSMTESIDRINIVHVINKLYSIKAYDGESVFVDTDDLDINSFYFAGIINGYIAPSESKKGVFGPYDLIRRGDFCIIESRVINNFELKSDVQIVEEVKTEVEEKVEVIEVEKKAVTLYDLRVSSLPEKCLNAADAERIWSWVVQNDLTEYVYKFRCTKAEAEDLMVNMESYFSDGLSNSLENNFYMFYDKGYILGYDGTLYKDYADLNINVVVDRVQNSKGYLYSENNKYFESIFQDMLNKMSVTDDMSVKEKAKSAYQYIDYVLEYDTNNFVPFNVKDNKAVCAGYTALYDYMLKRMGIESKAVFGVTSSYEDDEPGNHVWSCIKDETGSWYYADVTWGDGVPDGGYGYSNLDWFWLTHSELMLKDKNRVEMKISEF